MVNRPNLVQVEIIALASVAMREAGLKPLGQETSLDTGQFLRMGRNPL
jgi:hypothetical protein